MKEQSYTVSQVNRYLAQLFSEDFSLRSLTVSGEISNLKYHPSGHIYFTLKDAASQLSAVLFAGERAGLTFTLENGRRVLVSGRIGVYQRGGSYQLYAMRIRPDGIGELYLRFEELKRELSEMGMFDPLYKKPIPRYAQRIGIVTAKSGAAVRDIIQIAKRRNPYVELWLFPALVQGEHAAESIAEGIETLDRMGLDVLIVGRGGGSIEDLWAFNERVVAEAVFNADTPVISAVGHETDTTICDFAADLRAPTPSAAAELAVFDLRALLQELTERRERLDSEMRTRIFDQRQRLGYLRQRLSRENPSAVLRQERQRLDHIGERLHGQLSTALERSRQRLLRYPAFSEWMARRLERSRNALSLRAERLEAVSPLRKLSAGYAYLQDAEGRRVDSVDSVAAGELLRISLRDGDIRSRVESVEKMTKGGGA